MTEAKRIEHNLKVIEKIRGKSTSGGRRLAKVMSPNHTEDVEPRSNGGHRRETNNSR